MMGSMRNWTLIALLAAPAAFAAPAEYRFDPVHSQVVFYADHLGFSHSIGRFAAPAGSFRFDPDDMASASVDATVDVSSLDLGDEAWERKMLSDEFFDARAHPTMRFVSERVEPAGKDTLRIHGQLTLRGVTRPVVLETRVNRVGRHTYSMKYVAGFSATATLKRSEFGMTRLLPAVGDVVELRLEIEGIRSR
jgi:polyisoprenoid-binding protein YceI